MVLALLEAGFSYREILAMQQEEACAWLQSMAERNAPPDEKRSVAMKVKRIPK